MTFAVARDEAFNFTYRANIDALRREGEVIFFSPMRDTALPQCDVLYLPGGYPELFADELAANTSMRESIKAFADNDGKVFAECGGFMYLCHDIDGKEMCGVFAFSATMDGARLHLGYRAHVPTAGQQRVLRGHEFHYSSIINEKVLDSITTVEHLQESALGKKTATAIYRRKNVIAGYTHWYWAETGFADLYKNI